MSTWRSRWYGWICNLQVWIVVAASAVTHCSDQGGVGGEPAGDPATDPDLSEGQDLSWDQDSPGDLTDPFIAEHCTSIGALALARQVSHPGQGVELTVRIEDRQGLSPEQDLGGCLALVDRRTGRELPVVTAATPAGSRHTLILVVAGRDSPQHDLVRRAVRTLAEQVCADGRAAVYQWTGTVRQVVNFTDDLGRLTGRLQDGLVPYDGPYLAVDEALEIVRAIVQEVSGPAEASFRAVVVVAPQRRFVRLPDDRDGPVPVLWAVEAIDDPEASAVPPGRLVTASDHASPEEMGNELGGRLAEQAEAGFTALGWCGASSQDLLSIRARGADLEIPVEPVEPVPEEMNRDCDAARVARSERTFTSRIEFLFTTEQRAVFDSRVANLSGEDFQLSVRLDPQDEPAPAAAHIRGQSSLACLRKGFSVNLEGNQPRFLMPGSANDEFYLLSMCLDPYYVHQLTANQILSSLGLFPLRSTPVELLIDGESQGVYLLMEKPSEELLLDNARVTALLRRRIDIDGKEPDVIYGATSLDQALAEYDRLLQATQGLSGAELERAVARRMDLEQYLTWIALMSLLENGDYIDEVYFLGTEAADPTGAPGSYFTITTWDPEDLFTPCHLQGRFAIADEYGLLYCTESLLDHAIFPDALVYRRYVQSLDRVISAVTTEVFDLVLERTAQQLLPFFEEPAICSAMVELVEINPSADQPEVAQAEIRSALDDMRQRFAQRRELLLQRIDSYWAATGE